MPFNRYAKMLKWFVRGSWAIVDQALFASTHFVLNIFLARWLTPEQYGSFAIAYSILLLISNINVAIFLEPMLIFGAGKYADKLVKYLKFVVFGNFAINITISLIIIIIISIKALYGWNILATTILGMAIVLPSILLMWLLRKVCYLKFRSDIASLGSLAYMVIILSLLFGLFYIDRVSVFSAFILMGIGGFIVSLIFINHLKISTNWRLNKESISDYLKDHLKYSKWSLPTWIIRWVPMNIYYIILPLSIGNINASAELKASMNLIVPVTHFYMAMSSLILPAFVRNYNKLVLFKRRVNQTALLYMLCSIIYFVVIMMFGNDLFNKLYNYKYHLNDYFLILIGILPFLTGIISIYSTAVRAANQPKLAFWGYFFSALTTLIIGFPLAYLFGIQGVVIGLLVAMTVSLITMYILYRKMITSISL